MISELEKRLSRHAPAEPVEHAGPYSNLLIPVAEDIGTDEFRKKFVRPFYMANINRTEEFVQAYSEIRSQVDVGLISDLLSYYDWRPRKVGAFFAAIENKVEVTEHIGRLLLRSDVVYAGRDYALALAIFNSQESVDFLSRYLRYYLTRQDLKFDQSTVIGAIGYCDIINHTEILEEYRDAWDLYCYENKYKLSESIEYFSKLADSTNKIISQLKTGE